MNTSISKIEFVSGGAEITYYDTDESRAVSGVVYGHEHKIFVPATEYDEAIERIRQMAAQMAESWLDELELEGEAPNLLVLAKSVNKLRYGGER